MIRLLSAHIPARTLLLAFSEAVLACLTLLLAILVWFGSDADLALAYDFGPGRLMFASAVWILCMYCYGLYDSWAFSRPLGALTVLVVQVLGTVCVVLASVYFVYPGLQLGRGPFLIWILLSAAVLGTWRRAFFVVTRAARLVEKVVLVGAGPQAERLRAEIAAHPESGLEVVGCVGETPGTPGGAGSACLGPIEDLEGLVASAKISRLILVADNHHSGTPVQVLRLKAEGLPVHDGMRLYQAITEGVPETRPLLNRSGHPGLPRTGLRSSRHTQASPGSPARESNQRPPSESPHDRDGAMKCMFTVDVEDWFHILNVASAPALSDWGSLPSRVEANFFRVLELLSERNVHATCFFLGWIARKFPHLVREAAKQGHEIASHGYAHRLVYEMTLQEFSRDAVLSKSVIEDVLGQRILGYRSSGFSVNAKAMWLFEALVEAGYRYDSSVFPSGRQHGGLRHSSYEPFRIVCPGGDLVEVPITVAEVLGKPVCFFGGGYLRLFPLPVIRTMAYRVLDSGRPVVFYVHPREFDPDHPRLPMGARRRFKSYVNLRTTEIKVRSLLGEFEFTTLGSFISQHLGQTEAAPSIERIGELSPY